MENTPKNNTVVYDKNLKEYDFKNLILSRSKRHPTVLVVYKNKNDKGVIQVDLNVLDEEDPFLHDGNVLHELVDYKIWRQSKHRFSEDRFSEDRYEVFFTPAVVADMNRYYLKGLNQFVSLKGLIKNKQRTVIYIVCLNSDDILVESHLFKNMTPTLDTLGLNDQSLMSFFIKDPEGPSRNFVFCLDTDVEATDSNIVHSQAYAKHYNINNITKSTTISDPADPQYIREVLAGNAGEDLECMEACPKKQKALEQALETITKLQAELVESNRYRDQYKKTLDKLEEYDDSLMSLKKERDDLQTQIGDLKLQLHQSQEKQKDFTERLCADYVDAVKARDNYKRQLADMTFERNSLVLQYVPRHGRD